MSNSKNFFSVAALVVAGIMTVATAGVASAHGGGGRCGSGGVALHGPGSSHNPIIVGDANGQLHGPGTSHNPIVVGSANGKLHGPGSSHNPIIVGKSDGHRHHHHHDKDLNFKPVIH